MSENNRTATAVKNMTVQDLRKAVEQLKQGWSDVMSIPIPRPDELNTFHSTLPAKAKPSYTIHIIEDISAPDVPHMRTVPGIGYGGERVYEVHTVKREEDLSPEFQSLGRLTLLAVLAHELGHVIGHIFRLPHASQDPRGRYLGGFFHLTEHAMRVQKSEEEAWDLAELMLGIQNARTVALASYRRDIDLSQATYSDFKAPVETL